MFIELYNEVLYRPLFNLLIGLYHFLGQDMGVAIILLTLLIKLILFYPSLSQLKAQRALQQTQPKLKALKEQFKNNQEGYNRAVLQFYKENKVNPLASCLPLLIQLPILLALYQVFVAGVETDAQGLLATNQLERLYGPLRALYDHTAINSTFLGFLDITHSKNIVLAGLAAIATFWQARMLPTARPPSASGSGGKDEAITASLNRNMSYVLPVITFIFAYQFPAGLALYWLFSTLFQVLQQWYFLRRHPITSPAPSP